MPGGEEIVRLFLSAGDMGEYIKWAPRLGRPVGFRCVEGWPANRLPAAGPACFWEDAAFREQLRYRAGGKLRPSRTDHEMPPGAARLAAAAVVVAAVVVPVAAAAIATAAKGAAAAAAVAEQQNQNDDPPPVVIQAATDTVVIAHKITSDTFR